VLYEFYPLVRSLSLPIAILVVAIFVFLDRSTDRYRTFWYMAVIAMFLVTLELWHSVETLFPEVSRSSEPEEGSRIVLLLVALLKMTLATYLGASFYVLMALGWIPPKTFTRQIRYLTAVATTVTGFYLGLLFEERVKGRFEIRFHTRSGVELGQESQLKHGLQRHTCKLAETIQEFKRVELSVVTRDAPCFTTGSQPSKS